MHSWFNSRCKFIDRPEKGLAELIRSTLVQPSVESLAYIGAG